MPELLIALSKWTEKSNYCSNFTCQLKLQLVPKPISSLAKNFICAFGHWKCIYYQTSNKNWVKLISYMFYDKLDALNPPNIFEVLEHVLSLFLWGLLKCFAFHTCLVANCTYEVFPAPYRYCSLIVLCVYHLAFMHHMCVCREMVYTCIGVDNGHSMVLSQKHWVNIE